jgi:glycosyltransferase involved in cell wall biosynthesis
MTCPNGVCLDITRLTRRVGQGQHTGIDRVELAYLAHFLARPEVSIHGLCRIGRGLVLLDRSGLAAFAGHLAGERAWHIPGMVRRLSRRPIATLSAEATLTDLAVARVTSVSQAAHLVQHLPDGAVYLNVGHSNLEASVLGAFASGAQGGARVLLHDMIPLDFPQFQRAGTPQAFARRIAAVAASGCPVVVPSQAVAEDVRRHFAARDARPWLVVAPLGVTAPRLVAAAMPPGIATDRPYFVALGTIEPRKNHRLLLDLWAEFHRSLPAADIPYLHIVGRRGWNNADVFETLDRSPFVGLTVFEHGDLDDAGVAALLAGARGLVQPSLAEGFGYPPHEALCLGVQPILSPLAVYRETLGDLPVYASPDELYQWREAILALARNGEAEQVAIRSRLAEYRPGGWDAHFKAALTVFC